MKTFIRKSIFSVSVITALNLSFINIATAHCDSLDGPVITEAMSALSKGDVTPLLKWVPEKNEDQIKSVFDKSLQMRHSDSAAREFADHQLFETLVKVHRASEGAPYTGIKPKGGIDPIVIAADKALAEGDIDTLVTRITHKLEQSIRERFVATMKAKAKSGDSVIEGREFVNRYVQYVHYVEGVHNAMNMTGDHAHDAAESKTVAEAHAH